MKRIHSTFATTIFAFRHIHQSIRCSHRIRPLSTTKSDNDNNNNHFAARQLIVVRHGETDWNKALRVQGSTDIPLNDKGMAQAEASAESIQANWNPSYEKPHQIYSSPLARAKDTAVAIAGRLSEDDAKPIRVVTLDALKEWNLGVLEGLTKQKAIQEYLRDWRIFSKWADPFTTLEEADLPLTNGESMEQVRWRVVNAIDEIALKTKDGNTNAPILCVTHGGVLGQLLRHVVQTHTQPKTTIATYHRPGNACISTFELDISTGQNVPLRWSMKSWADTFHLTGDLQAIGANYDGSNEK